MWGAEVSTVKARLAGVGSVFWAESVARTSKVWAPSESWGEAVWVSPGPEQGPNEPESKRHAKLWAPPVAEKPKLGVGIVGRALGAGVDLRCWERSNPRCRRGRSSNPRRC